MRRPSRRRRLTGVGHKLRTAWMKQVLTAGVRARPWMSLRMPQFGEANVGRLPEEVASLEGTQPDDDVHKTPLSAAKIEAGRTLIGKNAFGCISCHDLAGIANTGTRGPDLAGMNQRVRYEWYLPLDGTAATDAARYADAAGLLRWEVAACRRC